MLLLMCNARPWHGVRVSGSRRALLRVRRCPAPVRGSSDTRGCRIAPPRRWGIVVRVISGRRRAARTPYPLLTDRGNDNTEILLLTLLDVMWKTYRSVCLNLVRARTI